MTRLDAMRCATTNATDTTMPYGTHYCSTCGTVQKTTPCQTCADRRALAETHPDLGLDTGGDE